MTHEIIFMYIETSAEPVIIWDQPRTIGHYSSVSNMYTSRCLVYDLQRTALSN
jgi:hypothetical protein